MIGKALYNFVVRVFNFIVEELVKIVGALILAAVFAFNWPHSGGQGGTSPSPGAPPPDQRPPDQRPHYVEVCEDDEQPLPASHVCRLLACTGNSQKTAAANINLWFELVRQKTALCDRYELGQAAVFHGIHDEADKLMNGFAPSLKGDEKTACLQAVRSLNNDLTAAVNTLPHGQCSSPASLSPEVQRLKHSLSLLR